jgi:hypothetical protein
MPDVPGRTRVGLARPEWGGGFDAGTIRAVPRVDRATWGRDRIQWAPAVDLLRPALPAVPHGDAPRAGRAAGEAAATLGRYRHCPGWVEPSGAVTVLGRAPTVERPHHPGHTRSAPEGRASGRLWVWRDACDMGALPPRCPGSGGHLGQRSYWAGRRPWGGPTTRAIPAVPQKDAPRMRISCEAGTGSGESSAAMVFAVAANATYKRPGLCPYAGCPGL